VAALGLLAPGHAESNDAETREKKQGALDCQSLAWRSCGCDGIPHAIHKQESDERKMRWDLLWCTAQEGVQAHPVLSLNEAAGEAWYVVTWELSSTMRGSQSDTMRSHRALIEIFLGNQTYLRIHHWTGRDEQAECRSTFQGLTSFIPWMNMGGCDRGNPGLRPGGWGRADLSLQVPLKQAFRGSTRYQTHPLGCISDERTGPIPDSQQPTASINRSLCKHA